MEKITIYKALDGTRFDSEKDCLSYEELINQTEQIMKKLGKAPDNLGFVNGGGYVQRSIEDVNKAKEELVRLSEKKFNQCLDFDFVGRYAEGYKCLYYAWHRLSSIDKKGREWGQPYYAINPGQGKQVEFKQ